MDIARASAWLVVGFYVIALILDIRQISDSTRRAIWTLGATSLFAHIAWTMLAVHHGSLSAAYEHTALQTKQLIGIEIGAGIYINFAMLVAWIADAAAWWLIPRWTSTRRRFLVPLHAVFVFLFLNATVVFGTTLGRIIGVVAGLAVASAWLLKPANALDPKQK